MASSFMVRMGPPDQMLSAVCWAATGDAMAMLANSAAPMPRTCADRCHAAWAADPPGKRRARRSFVWFPSIIALLLAFCGGC